MSWVCSPTRPEVRDCDRGVQHLDDRRGDRRSGLDPKDAA